MTDTSTDLQAGSEPRPEGASTRKRRRSQPPKLQKRSQRLFAGAIVGVLLVLAIFGAVAWQRLQYFNSNSGSNRFASAQATSSMAGSLEKTGAHANERPVYRYSVVPGGVRSPEELLEAMTRDSVVAEHYAGVDPAKMRTEHLREPMQAHVSYRVADRVYWTNRKITLQAGERVLTDGKTIVRGRCGNSVSADPLLPTLDSEPRPAAFDSIINPVSASGQGLDPAMSYLAPSFLTSSGLMPGPGGTSFGGSGSGMLPPSGITTTGRPPTGEETTKGGTQPGGTPTGIPPGGTPPENPPTDPPGDPRGNPPGDPPPPEFTPTDFPDPPTPVPEPGTLLLVAAGAAALLAHRLRKQSQ